MYICFGIKDCNNSVGFFSHYFESGLFNHEIYGIAQEGARNHGLLNVSPIDFFETHLVIPELEEQKAIAKVLDCADREIKTLKSKLAVLKDQKKGLMQQLLTGRTRVKV